MKNDSKLAVGHLVASIRSLGVVESVNHNICCIYWFDTNRDQTFYTADAIYYRELYLNKFGYLENEQ